MHAMHSSSISSTASTSFPVVCYGESMSFDTELTDPCRNFHTVPFEHHMSQASSNCLLCHILVLVQKYWQSLMLNKEINGPFWRQAGSMINPVTSFWMVSSTKISDKVSHVTPLSKLNEMVLS